MRTIIFDFDGVIHDTFKLIYKVNAEVFGKNLTEDKYRDFFDGNIFERSNIDKKTEETFFKLQNEAFKYLKLEDNIRENLEKLSENHALFIISSNQEKALNSYFKNNKFTHIFREILGAETHKSKVAKFNYLFKKYGLSADDCFFVTDTLGDILDANKVGVRTIAVDFGFHKRDNLKKGNPFKIVSSFNEISETIEICENKSKQE